MIYKLETGSRVRTTHYDGGTEFETTNADREVISTVWLPAEKAAPMINRLQVADSIRFVKAFGGGAGVVK
ncbi:hypothetical protein ACWGJW_02550 [Streptomyces nigrescens]